MIPSAARCRKCNELIVTDEHYCGNCGHSTQTTNSEKDSLLTSVFIFYCIILLLVVVNSFYSNSGYGSDSDVLIESLFVFTICKFFAIDYKGILPLLLFDQSYIPKIIVTIPLAVISSVVVHYGMNALNQLLFGESTLNYLELYDSYSNPLLASVFFVAVLPGFFEEIGFRGFLYNKLIQLTNPLFTIMLSAFLFSLVHFSIVSLIWLFPFGMVLGYFRLRFQTLWIGISLHFFHNLFILLLDYFLT